MGRYTCSPVRAVAEEAAAMTRNPMAFSSSSLSSQSSRPPAAQQNNQMGGVLKRKKANIRILVDGDEMVVSPYFSLPADAIVLDPRPQSSKRGAKDEGHIQSQPSNNVHKRSKSTSDGMLMEKNLNYTRDKSSSSLSFQSSRPPAAQRDNQMGDVSKRKKANIRILLLNGDEMVVSPYFALPPNAIILDPRPQSSSKGRADEEGRIQATSDEMLMGKNLNHNSFKKKKKSITLSAAGKKLDIYKRVSPDNTWVAPRSPHQLLQEEHCHDPWRVLIICMLLNRTRGEQVKASGVLTELFKMCPDAEAATKVQEKDLRDLLRPLGLHGKKAVDIKKLSSKYLESTWTHVTDLHGVGKYAADAYAIFCVGKPEEVTPLDHKLIDYWKFVCK